MPTGDHHTIETHLSRVVLREHDVLKTLKPVRFPFVDQSTLERRRSCCEAELEHNRPWAPDVYLGVVTTDAGEPAVHMRRLDADATLVARRATLSADDLRALGRFLRERHDALAPVEDAATVQQVSRRIHDNLAELLEAADDRFDTLMSWVGEALHRRLEQDHQLLAERADVGQTLHGDLRAEHVYLTDDGFRILDGVAFDVELASGDPIEDVAFLAMDLACSLGRWDLVEPLWEGWGDAEPALRSLYAGHRSLIRAKVALLSDDPPGCRRHLLHALVHWEEPDDRPCIVAIGGLPGVGKSTVARELAERGNLAHLRTDDLRKEDDTDVDYSDAGRTAVYERMMEAVEERVQAGERVVVDASFGKETWRRLVIERAEALGVPLLFAFCVVDEEEALRRLENRRGDASDADADVHALARKAWEPLSDATERWSVTLSTATRGGGPRLLERLAERGLATIS